MAVNDKTCDALNDRLDVIAENFDWQNVSSLAGNEGIDEIIQTKVFPTFEVDDFSSSNEVNSKLIATCFILATATIGENISARFAGSVQKLNEFADELGFVARPNDPLLHYKLVNFFASQFQSKQLALKHQSEEEGDDMKVDAPEDDQMEVVEESTNSNSESSLLVFEIEKLAKLLHVELGGDTDVPRVLQQSINKIRTYDQSILTSIPTILKSELREQFTSKQTSIILGVENALYQDFCLRREILLKRLDVTLESFLLSSKSMNNNKSIEELKIAINTQQQYLHRAPTRYQVEDAWEAPATLVSEQSCRVTGEKNRKESLVKRVVFTAQVPDRGGRVTDQRQKKFFDNFSSNNGGGRGNGNRNNNNKGGRGNNNNNNQSKDKDHDNKDKDNNKDNNNGNNSDKKKGEGEGRIVTVQDNNPPTTTTNNNNKNNNNNNKRNKPALDSNNKGRTVELVAVPQANTNTNSNEGDTAMAIDNSPTGSTGPQKQKRKHHHNNNRNNGGGREGGKP